MKAAGLALGLLLWGATAAAQAPAGQEQPQPQPGRVLRDRDFGVSRTGFGLDRHVEMYQWRAGAGGYERVWNSAPIDSAAFPPEYRNPGPLPIQSRRWWAGDATLAGRPLDVEVLRALGRWVEFRPDFAKLPANLAASFQPEGNGLGSSENPLAPEVGDLRIRWRELELDDVGGRVELRDGTWRLTPEAAARAVAPAEVAIAIDPDAALVKRWWPWLAGGAFVVLVGMVVGSRRGSRDRE